MNALTHSRRARWLPFLILLMLLGGILRLVNLDAPPMDFQPTRQMRNSLVARAIYYHALPGADLLRPIPRRSRETRCPTG